jgi:hypothetical protein
MTRRWLVAMMLFGSAAVASPSEAAPPCQEHEIALAGPAPASLERSASPNELIDATARVIRDKLGLPFSPAYKAYVCSDEAAFAEALLRNFGVRGVGGDWGIVPSAAGLATRVGVFLRGDYLARTSFRRRVTVIAHELAHLSQQDLARHRDERLPVWMLEGHADWVAFQVLDLLGLKAYAESRAGIVRSVTGAVTPVERFPDLDTLADHESWNRSVRSVPATYGQAFLAVEYLIERSSRAALVKFMRSSVEADDPRERWAEAFAMPYRAFVHDFRAYLERLGRPATGLTVEPKSPP